MEPEKRMILAAALLAVAQQDWQLVKWLGVRPSKVEQLSRAIASEALLFVASDAFEEMCDTIDIEVERLREMHPEVALNGYQKLTSDSWSDSEKII
jgi:hypothetical protein